VTIESINDGRGDLVEGSDTLIVTISRLPQIEVFAGQSQTVESGETVKFSGSFTRPSELTTVSFTWDFGDGSEMVEGTLEAGVTAALAEHTYSDHRPAPYRATLTVRGDSEAGEVESQSIVLIKVDEAPGYTLGGWSAGDSWKTIIRTLSGVGQVLVTILFWVGVLSPLWLVVIGAYIWRRRRNAPLV
jgi:PKD repeat protein